MVILHAMCLVLKTFSLKFEDEKDQDEIYEITLCTSTHRPKHKVLVCGTSSVMKSYGM